MALFFCRYECYIKKTYEHCKCIPWDYIHNIENAKECDIFGRTCFFNVYDNLVHNKTNHCSECVEQCDKLIFKTKKVNAEPLEFQTNGFSKCNQYVCSKRFEK